jgi:hypothetical protein
MGVAIALLRTAAVVGVGLLTNQQTRRAASTGLDVAENVKKNAAGVFLVLFLRDILRSLIVVFFIGVAAIVACAVLQIEPLLRAAWAFTGSVFLVAVIVTAVLFAKVKTLGNSLTAM